MQSELKKAAQATDNLEYLLPDLADAAESQSEIKAILNVCNRLAILINETRRQLR